MNRKKYTVFSISTLFLLSLLVMLKQMLSDHYFSCFTSDTYMNTSWASQFIDALKEGIIYPRWTPLNFWGYGNPTFILYGPLAFYMIAVFHIFSDSLIFAMKLAGLLSLFVSASWIFLLTREIYNEKVAFISGIVYIFFPFYIFDHYIGGFFPSSISIMWFPLILFFIIKYMKKSEYLYLLYAGVCYGGLIFTHLINAYMFTFIIITFIIYMSIAEKKPKYLFAIPILILFGILRSNNLKIKKEINTFNKFLIGVSFFSLFMLFGPSIFLSEKIPFFNHIQPVRWLSITDIAVV